MSNVFIGLWESIFTPGPTPALVAASNAAFAALQLILLVLLVYTYSVHFLVLSVLSAGLWWGINWFVAELAIQKAKEVQEKREREAQAGVVGMSSSDSETEVEGATPAPRSAAAKKSEVAKAPAEPVEPAGEVRKRGGGLSVPEDAMTQSSVSTEDEWEKVSESEEKK